MLSLSLINCTCIYEQAICAYTKITYLVIYLSCYFTYCVYPAFYIYSIYQESTEQEISGCFNLLKWTHILRMY